MRVRDVSYTKNHLSVIIEVFRPLLKKGKVVLCQSKRIRSRIRSGCVSITLSSPPSIEEKLFIINIKVICVIYPEFATLHQSKLPIKLDFIRVCRFLTVVIFCEYIGIPFKVHKIRL